MYAPARHLLPISRFLRSFSCAASHSRIARADCYNRYTAQFHDLEVMMHGIMDACILSRVVFRDPDELHRLWRFLNLMHTAAYTGLTPGKCHAPHPSSRCSLAPHRLASTFHP